jgi:cation:H+ antiporter
MGLAGWVGLFAIVALVVVAAGVRLAAAADEIAEVAGLSRVLVGILLVAAATSLPELVINVSAVANGAPDLAVGSAFGSTMANMAILAVLDLMGRNRVWPEVEIGHARVASIAIGMTALATLGILVPDGPRLGWVGIETVALVVAYVAAIAWMHRSPTGRFAQGGVLPVPTGWTRPEPGALRPSVVRFVVAAGVILVTGPVAARSAEEIATLSGLGLSFVGASLLPLATAMPELVVSVAAVRIGARDLAVGNLFGSNAFNMASLVVADLVYRDGPILAAVAPTQAVAGVAAIVLMALALAAIVHGTETTVKRLEPDALVLLAAYGGALFAVWRA